MKDIKLIKGFFEGSIVLYWINHAGEVVSPHLHSKLEAEEWWLEYQFSPHPSTERRSSSRAVGASIANALRFPGEASLQATNHMGSLYSCKVPYPSRPQPSQHAEVLSR